MAIKKNKRIAVIGAGPAGLSAAYYLQQKGYHDITIYEKENYVGGKCCSFSYKDKKFDLGAILISPSNFNIKSIIRKFNAKTEPQQGEQMIYDVPTKTLLPIKKSKMYTAGALATFAAISKFIYLSNKYRAVKKPGIVNIPEELLINADEFIDRNGLQPIKNLFTLVFTNTGYDDLKKIPAFMLIKFLRIPGALAFFVMTYTGANYLKLLRISGGYQSLWEKVAQSMDVVLEADIKNIAYKDQGVVIESRLGTASFNKLIVTAPLDHIIDKFEHPVLDKILIKKLQYQLYVTHIFVIHDMCPRDHIYVIPPLAVGPLIISFYQLGDVHVCVTFSVNYERVKDEELLKIIQNTLCEIGLKPQTIELVTHKNWEYFPHVDVNDIKSGFYDKIAAAQGVNNTYYAGSQLDYESVERTISFSKYLVEKYF